MCTQNWISLEAPAFHQYHIPDCTWLVRLKPRTCSMWYCPRCWGCAAPSADQAPFLAGASCQRTCRLETVIHRPPDRLRCHNRAAGHCACMWPRGLPRRFGHLSRQRPLREMDRSQRGVNCHRVLWCVSVAHKKERIAQKRWITNPPIG